MTQTAFVFPGQGSQSIGMLADFASNYPIVKNTFMEVSDTLGYDLWELIQSGPEERLNQTEYTQVAMLTADSAIFRVLQEQGVAAPQIMAGHSLGEYAALVASNSLSLTDAACLVARRGQVMQQSIPLGLGAMAAIVGLSDEQVQSLCEEASQDEEVVTPANFNAIGQVVVAGYDKAVERMIILADAADARLAKKIPVSVPCHCPLLKDASLQFAKDLAAVEFKIPEIPVVSNVDLSIYDSAAHIRDRLAAQLYSPVRWVETIQLFKNKGVELIIECGPGKVLNGLVKRIDRSIEAMAVYDTTSLLQVTQRVALSK